ncbi:MAG: sporulation protein YtxC [Clostridia bacterium]
MQQVCSAGTREYEADIRKLLVRRLKHLGYNELLVDDADKSNVAARLTDEMDMNVWCEALSGVLLRDVAHFELARMVNMLPIPLTQKQMVLPEAIKCSREVGSASTIRRMLAEHYRNCDKLNLEGFVRFRMQDVMAGWEMCVMRAAEELMLQNEYLELMSVLSAFVQLQPSRIKDVSVILNPDGSCTLTDDMDSRIDYEKCTEDGVVSVLVGLAPERITVYDLSGGQNTMLAEVLIRVFEDRVRFFK